MSDSTLYAEDILLWSEQQAAAIRKLARLANSLPNELDIENVAEEIESVGRSELASVESYLQLILLHMMKLFAAEKSRAARHWQGEVFTFHASMMRRYSPSMRGRIDLDALWRGAREQLLISSRGNTRRAIELLPSKSIFELDDLLQDRIDTLASVRRLKSAAR